MDRLPAVGHVADAALAAPRVLALALALGLLLGVLLGLAGCPDESAPAPSRVNAVSAARKRARPASDDFCDVAPRPGALRFSLPPLAAAASAPAAGTGWRWVNVWATWCKPCVAELPLLARWPARLSQGGVPVSLLMLSVDESDAALQRFRKEHPELPAGARLAGPGALAPWLTGLGLSADTSIPVHVFVDPQGQVRCVRAGTLESSDYPRVAAVLSR
jgi:thiol-disulfide isomerase/thioredoxin